MSRPFTLHTGHAPDVLRSGVIERGSVNVVVTSPPYYALRAYGDDPAEIGDGADGVRAYIDGLMESQAARRNA